MGIIDDFFDDVDWGDVGKAVGGAVGGSPGALIGSFAGNRYDDYLGNMPDSERTSEWTPSLSNVLITQGARDWVSNRQDKKDTAFNAAADRNRYVNLRRDALAGGFHPLEALRAGGAAPIQSQPRLLSSTSRANVFDAVENWETARRDQLAKAEDKAEQKRNAANESVRGGPRLGERGNVTAMPGRLTNPTDDNITTNNEDDQSLTPPWVQNAEEWEGYAGEFGGNIMGLRNLLSLKPYNDFLTEKSGELNIPRLELHRRIAANPRYLTVLRGGRPKVKPSAASRGIAGTGDFNYAEVPNNPTSRYGVTN